MNTNSLIGVDMGGTKILAGRLEGEEIIYKKKVSVPKGNQEEIFQALCNAVDGVFDQSIKGIGVGVPSVVDIEEGIVYDVQNIPSWREIHLKKLLEEKYRVPVYINNDANCFAAGVKYFGKGKDYKDLVALIIGTGIAAGIMIDNKLYNGSNGGAGEFGMIPYLDHHFEYYCSGQFFQHIHQTSGEVIFQQAKSGDLQSLEIWMEFGTHLGNAITAVLYALDPPVIILGGSVSQAYPYFKDAMWKRIGEFVYRNVPERLKILVSKDPDLPLLGAAALYLNAEK